MDDQTPEQYWINVEPKSTCGWVALAISSGALMPSSIVIGVARGVVTKLKGKSFQDGFEKPMFAVGKAIDAASKFGDKHNDTVMRGLLNGASTALGGIAVRGALRRR